MAIIEQTGNEVNRNRVAALVLAGLAGVAVIAVLVFLLDRPPQMGADEDVFVTVDALYTAVRLKDESKLRSCEERLHGYRAAGKLPAAPAEYLDDVIANTRAGRWDTAAKRLYSFMIAQRREGTLSRQSGRREPDPRGQDSKRR